MYKPHTIEQYKIQQFLDHTFAMEHFLVSPLSRSALMLEDRCGERIAFPSQTTKCVKSRSLLRHPRTR